MRLTLRLHVVEGIRSYVDLKIMAHVDHSSINYILRRSNINIRLYLHIETPKHGQLDTSTRNHSRQLTTLISQKRGGFVTAESKRLVDYDDDILAAVDGVTFLCKDIRGGLARGRG